MVSRSFAGIENVWFNKTYCYNLVLSLFSRGYRVTTDSDKRIEPTNLLMAFVKGLE